MPGGVQHCERLQQLYESPVIRLQMQKPRRLAGSARYVSPEGPYFPLQKGRGAICGGDGGGVGGRGGAGGGLGLAGGDGKGGGDGCDGHTNEAASEQGCSTAPTYLIFIISHQGYRPSVPRRSPVSCTEISHQLHRNLPPVAPKSPISCPGISHQLHRILPSGAPFVSPTEISR